MQGWVRSDGEPHHEVNPLMGRHPSPYAVDVYFAATAVASAAVWLVLPEKLRPFWGGGIAAVQARVIAINVDTTRTACGFGVYR